MVRSLFLARHAAALTTSSKDDFNRKLSALGYVKVSVWGLGSYKTIYL